MAFSDVTALAVGYLDPIVDPVTVATRVPGDRPVELVQVRRVGGTALAPFRETVRLDVMCWAEDEVRAQELASAVRAAMWATAGNQLLGATVYRVSEFLGPRMDDDDEAGTPRVWATYDLVVRANDVTHYSPSL